MTDRTRADAVPDDIIQAATGGPDFTVKEWPTSVRPSAAQLARHFGDEHHDAHWPTSVFDFYCVAHGEDYSPKYMNGVICHDGMGEGLCADECNRCPVPCPIEPCPIPEAES